MDIIRSVVGTAVLLVIAFLLSVNKKSTSLRTVGAALLLQIAIGDIAFYFPSGEWAVEQAVLGVHRMMPCSDADSAFVFDSLIEPKMDVPFDGAGLIFASRVLPAIVFVTALISLLYYIDVTGLLICILGGIFQKALNISRIEFFVTVVTIFLRQNEVPAIVEPFIGHMNHNELFTAICSGMASIADSMMIGYVGVGVPADYLLAASLMAIPGSILFTRILSPAMEPSQVTFENLSFSETPPKSIIEAAANGATTRLKIAAGVATAVMTFATIVALIDGITGGVGGWFGFTNVFLGGILGYVLAPLAWIMGMDWSDVNLVGSLIEQRLTINEFVAYLNLSPYLQTNDTPDVKTVAITSFALYRFTDFGSIGVVVEAFPAISPKRAPEIAQPGLWALMAVTFSSLMSATIAGFFTGSA